MTEPPPIECDGLCVWATELGVLADGVAYPHPGCPLHAPGEVCGCGMPDRCLSPTHRRHWKPHHLGLTRALDGTYTVEGVG